MYGGPAKCCQRCSLGHWLPERTLSTPIQRTKEEKASEERRTGRWHTQTSISSDHSSPQSTRTCTIATPFKTGRVRVTEKTICNTIRVCMRVRACVRACMCVCVCVCRPLMVTRCPLFYFVLACGGQKVLTHCGKDSTNIFLKKRKTQTFSFVSFVGGGGHHLTR